MRNISRCLGVMIVVLALASLGFAQATTPAPAPAPGERQPAPGGEKQQPAAKPFEGTLVKIDTTAKTLTAKGADNKEMQFTYTDKTEVMGSEKTVQGLSTKSGAKLRITYNSEKGVNNASRIEVMPE